MDTWGAFPMLPNMAKDKDRIRITIDTQERHRRAFLLFGAAKGLSVPQAFAHVVESQMAEYLAIADKELAAESEPAKPVKKPRA